MINVTLQNFETDVMAASMTTPILLDFWAPWCGPCQSLGPILEQLEADFMGRFILAKVNSDAELQLASAFGVRSIPTCILVIDGRPVDGFMGAQSTAQVKTFLDKHLPSEGELAAQADASAAQALLESGDKHAALSRLADALAASPDNDDTRYDYIRLMIEMGGTEEARVALAPKLSAIPRQLRFDALALWLDAIQSTVTGVYACWSVAQFDAHILANKRDFEARIAKARLLMAVGDWTAAMDELLEIIMRDKKWADEAPRKNMVAILELLTPPRPKGVEATPGKTATGIELQGQAARHEEPQAALVSAYRRRLSMTLN